MRRLLCECTLPQDSERVHPMKARLLGESLPKPTRCVVWLKRTALISAMAFATAAWFLWSGWPLGVNREQRVVSVGMYKSKPRHAGEMSLQASTRTAHIQKAPVRPVTFWSFPWFNDGDATTTTTTTTTTTSPDWVNQDLHWMHENNIDLLGAATTIAGILSIVLGRSWNSVVSLLDPKNGFLKYTLCPSDFQAEAKRRGISVSTFVSMLIANEVDHEWEIVDELTEGEIAQSSLNADQKARMKAWLKDVTADDAKKDVYRLLVMGETSDGKSTLVNNILARERDGPCRAESNTLGTTKRVRGFNVRGQFVNDRFPATKLVLYDCPGLGDHHISPHMLLQQLSEEQKVNKGTFDGLLMVTKANDGSLKLGPRIMAQVLDCAFGDARKWDCVVLVGTHGDLATEAQRQNFPQKLEALNEKEQASIKRACVVDCRPFSDNRKNPNLAPLWAEIEGLIRERNKAKANKHHLHLGNVADDANTRQALVNRLSPLLNEKDKVLLGQWEKQFQLQREAIAAAEIAQKQCEDKMKKQEQEMRRKIEEYERKSVRNDETQQLATLLGTDLVVKVWERRLKRWGGGAWKYQLGNVTSVEEGMLGVSFEGSKQSYHRRNVFIFGLDLKPVWIEIGGGNTKDGIAKFTRSISADIVYVHPDAANIGRREGGDCDSVEFHTHIRVGSDGIDNQLFCIRLDNPAYPWCYTFKIKCWKLKSSAGRKS